MPLTASAPAAPAATAEQCLDAARDYLRRGWRVIPIPAGIDYPLLPNWRELVLTPKDLPRYFSRPCNIGVLLGKSSGGLVDVELADSTMVFVANRLLPQTDCVFGTASVEASRRVYRCEDIPAAARLDAPDGSPLVEIRAEGALTMFPPSTRANGRRLEWATPQSVAVPPDPMCGGRAPLCESDRRPHRTAGDLLGTFAASVAITWLLSRCWPAHDDACQVLCVAMGKIMIQGPFTGGTVHGVLSIAAQLAGGRDIRAYLDLIPTYGVVSAGDPDPTGIVAARKILSDPILARIGKWIGKDWQFPPLAPGEGKSASPDSSFPPLPSGEGRSEGFCGTAAPGGVSPQAEDPPQTTSTFGRAQPRAAVPHDRCQLPTSRAWPSPLGEAAYFGLAGRIVRVIEPHTEADPAALLVQLLTCVGNAAGRSPHFFADGARHGTNLFFLLVGNSSKARKGTSWSQIFRLMEQADPGWARACVTTGLSSGEGLIHAIRDAVTRGGNPPVTTRPQDPSIDSDKSGNKDKSKAEVLDPGVADKRLLVFEGEFAQCFKTLRREGNILSPVLRSAWDGCDLRTLTRTNPAVATAPHVSVIGHITREELRTTLPHAEAFNGFANRFAWVCCKRSKRLPEGGQIAGDALEEPTLELMYAIAFAKEAGPMTRDEASRQLWRQVYPNLSAERPGMLGAITSRAEAQVMRFAAVYALLDRTTTIRVEHLQAAIALWDYCDQSAAHIFGVTSGDPLADEILAALKNRPEGMTRTEITNYFHRHQKGTRIDEALELLAEASTAICVRDEADDGRPAERWVIAGASAT